MKLVAILLLLVPMLGLAELDGKDVCKNISGTAELVMQSRQGGVPLNDILPLMETIGNIGTDMVIDAYDSPRYRTAEAQARAISEFKNEQHVKCLKAYRG